MPDTEPQSELAPLVTRYLAGDEDAFAALLKIVGPEIERFLRRKCTGDIDVDDLFQQTWTNAWQKREQFKSKTEIFNEWRAWVFRIARNKFLDEKRRAKRRRAKRRRIHLSDQIDAAEVQLAAFEAENKSTLEKLHACIAKLEQKFRHVIEELLRGTKPEQLAETLSLSRTTVYTRKSRAIKLLRDCMERNS